MFSIFVAILFTIRAYSKSVHCLPIYMPYLHSSQAMMEVLTTETVQ